LIRSSNASNELLDAEGMTDEQATTLLKRFQQLGAPS
jgi:hypothetical protein